MASPIRKLVQLVLDKAAANRTEADAKKALGGIDQAMDRLGTVVKRVGAAIAAAFAIQKLVQFGREVLKLGVDAGEVASKFSTTFGDATERVQEFVDSWGAIAGLNQNEAKDFLATSAAMAQGMGYARDAAADLAIEVAKVAGDLTSFNNVPIEQTSRAVRSALVGEREALKTLGIVVMEADVQTRALVQSGKSNVAQLTQQEKATATLSLIQERMGVAAGDLERTQDSVANTLRRTNAEWENMKIALGEALVNVTSGPARIKALTDAVERLTTWLKTNNQEVSTWADNTITAITGVVKIGVGAFRFLFNTGQMIGNTMEVVFRTFVGDIAGIINVGIDGINLLQKAYNKVSGTEGKLLSRMDTSGNWKEVNRAMTDIAKNATDAQDALIQVFTAFNAPGKATAPGKRATGISAPDQSGGGPSRDIGAEKAAIKELSEARKEAISIMESLMTPQEKYNAMLALLKTHLDAGRLSQETYNRGVAAAKEELDKALASQDKDKEAKEEALRITEALRTANEIYTEAVARLKTHLDAGLISQETYSRGVVQAKKELEEATKVTDSVADALQAHDERLRSAATMSEILGSRYGALQDEAASLMTTMQALADAGVGPADERMKGFAERLRTVQGELQLASMEMVNLEDVAKLASTVVGAALGGDLSRVAAGKAQMNALEALEWGIRAIGAALNPFTVGLAPGYAAMAAKHGAMAAAWAAFGKVTAKGGSGAGGVSGAGSSPSGISRDAGGRASEKMTGPEINIYLDPFDENKGTHQRKVGTAAIRYIERYGSSTS